jgi:hypothetical protein
MCVSAARFATSTGMSALSGEDQGTPEEAFDTSTLFW